ncbi:hypothetical protein [Micromonospora rubida]
MARQLAPHLYAPDRDAAPGYRDELPCRACPLPKGNRVHTVPDTAEAQAEHLRRIGGDR